VFPAIFAKYFTGKSGAIIADFHFVGFLVSLGALPIVFVGEDFRVDLGVKAGTDGFREIVRGRQGDGGRGGVSHSIRKYIFFNGEDNTLDLMEDFYDSEECMFRGSSVKDVGKILKTEVFWLAILVPALSTPSIIFLALNYSLFLKNNGFSETDAGLHTGFVFCVGVGAALFTGLSSKVRL
jgi:hypothetical protein